MRDDQLAGTHDAHVGDGRKMARFFRKLWRLIRPPIKAAAMLFFIAVAAKLATVFAGGVFETNVIITALVWIMSDIDDIKSKLAFLENDDE
jgi:ABC-type Fe3+ transport system permease subunit